MTPIPKCTGLRCSIQTSEDSTLSRLGPERRTRIDQLGGQGELGKADPSTAANADFPTMNRPAVTDCSDARAFTLPAGRVKSLGGRFNPVGKEKRRRGMTVRAGIIEMEFVLNSNAQLPYFSEPAL